jgi:internalin A
LRLGVPDGFKVVDEEGRTFEGKENRIADLAPLARLTALQSLVCYNTQVADLAPLAGLSSLGRIDASYLKLAIFDRSWTEPGRLDELILVGSRIPDLPSGILSAGYGESCLPSLRAYFEDSVPDDARLNDVKLMLLGNGRVGKTQLARALLQRPFELKSRSTHGVTIESYELSRPVAPIPLHIWDFGGQDIYHGTHALFLRDHAIFALVWKRADAPGEPADAYSTDQPLR